MQTQPRSRNSLRQDNVVRFVVSTCLIVTLGLSVIGTTPRANMASAHAQSTPICSKTDRVHTVVAGDRLTSIAAYYGLREQDVARYNHLALNNSDSLYPNRRICIPDVSFSDTLTMVRTYSLPKRHKAPVMLPKLAVKKAKAKKRDLLAIPAFRSVHSDPSAWSVSIPLSDLQLASGLALDGMYNVFPFGQCTWWASQRYYQLHGVFVPWRWNANAGQWVDRAYEFGWRVSSVPKVGSIIVLQGGVQGAARVGHVGVVERVLHNGVVIASSMNWDNQPGDVTLSPFVPGPGVSFLSK
ncbi:MAG TPA: CHAP domain-containing protein [Dictyobacter sp.]|nr:CHAP domain-containing protein [Dictyobacter sp.]